MSPELLHNGQDGTDQAYDPRSTDVWAAGVMLVVALCGAFPFDHTQHHHRSMEEAEVDLWYSPSTPPACAGYPVLTVTPRSEVLGHLKTQVCILMLILLLLCMLMLLAFAHASGAKVHMSVPPAASSHRHPSICCPDLHSAQREQDHSGTVSITG